jgi:hypothetical protein
MLKERKKPSRQTRIAMHFNFTLVIQHGEIENGRAMQSFRRQLNILLIFLPLTQAEDFVSDIAPSLLFLWDFELMTSCLWIHRLKSNVSKQTLIDIILCCNPSSPI